MKKPVVGIIMGSQSDLPVMSEAATVLKSLGIPFEITIVSAHRTPKRMVQYAQTAAIRDLKVIIAGAGGSAHLPGMVASLTTLPVIGVPIKSRNSLDVLDSILSIVQMPAGIPVGTLAIGKAGAKNAALLAIAMLATTDSGLRDKLQLYRETQTKAVLAAKLEA